VVFGAWWLLRPWWCCYRRPWWATVIRLHAHLLSDALGGVAVGYGTVLAVVALVAHPPTTAGADLQPSA